MVLAHSRACGLATLGLVVSTWAWKPTPTELQTSGAFWDHVLTLKDHPSHRPSLDAATSNRTAPPERNFHSSIRTVAVTGLCPNSWTLMDIEKQRDRKLELKLRKERNQFERRQNGEVVIDEQCLSDKYLRKTTRHRIRSRSLRKDSVALQGLAFCARGHSVPAEKSL